MLHGPVQIAHDRLTDRGLALPLALDHDLFPVAFGDQVDAVISRELDAATLRN
jgi:hypothetical protein